MKDVLNNMISHPVKTSCIVFSIGCVISCVIDSIRGNVRKAPIFNIVAVSKEKPNTCSGCREGAKRKER